MCGIYPTQYQWIVFSDFVLREPNGTRHHFPLTLNANQNPCGMANGSSGSMLADDGSGWLLQVNLSSGYSASAIRKDGFTVSNLPFGSGGTITSTDTNGNQAVWNTQNSYLTDTLGRTINLDGSYFDPSGALRSLKVTTAPVSINLSNVAQYLGFVGNTCTNCFGTPNLINSITLPNGLSYQINYVQGADGL
jgi:hypothetical protein